MRIDGTDHNSRSTLHVHSEPRGPSLSRKPPETPGKTDPVFFFSKRTMVAQNGKGINPWNNANEIARLTGGNQETAVSLALMGTTQQLTLSLKRLC